MATCKIIEDEESSGSDNDEIKPQEDLLRIVRSKDTEKSKLEKINKLFQMQPNLFINFQDKNYKGNTALHFAIRRKENKIAKILMKKGANPEIENDKGESPIYIAKALNLKEILQLLEPTKDEDQTQLHGANLKGFKCIKNNLCSDKIKHNELKFSVNSEKRRPMPGFIGNLYQVKLLMLLLNEGISLNYNFYLGTEIEEAKKFDDIVFQYCENKKHHSRILQVKHRKNGNDKINIYNLLTKTDTDFSLVKYFYAYQEAKQEKFFKNSAIEYMIVYTNSDFDFDRITGPLKDLITIKDITKEVDKSDDIRDIFKERGELYRFKKSIVPILQEIIVEYNFYRLANKIVECLLKNKLIDHNYSIFKPYHIFLSEVVIDSENKKFYNSFIEGKTSDGKDASSEVRLFHDLLNTIIFEKTNKKFSLKTINVSLRFCINKIKHFEKEINKEIVGEVSGNKESMSEVLAADLKLLAENLVDCMFDRRLLNDILFEKFGKFLVEKVVNVKLGTFRSEFVTNKGKDLFSNWKIFVVFKEILEKVIENRGLNLEVVNEAFAFELILSSGFGGKNKTKKKQKWLRGDVNVTGKILTDSKDLAENNLKELAKELCESLLNGKLIKKTNKVFENFNNLLERDIFDVQSKTFREHFVIRELKNEEKDKSLKGLNKFKDFFKKEIEASGLNFYNLNELIQNGYITLNLSQDFVYEEKKLNYSCWPKYSINCEEICEFLNLLIFAVNQPNELELDKILQEKVCTKFNLINSEFIASYFQKEIADWMKGNNSFANRFISLEDGKSFFAKAQRKMDSLLLIGPTIEYQIKTEKFNISFDDIDSLNKIHNFLLSNKKIFNFISSQITLSAIKVFQILKKYQAVESTYREFDSFIFMQLNSILTLKCRIYEAFKSKNSNNLMIIVGESVEKSLKTEISELFTSITDIINSTGNKKIIFLSKKDNYLSVKWKIEFAESNLWEEKIDEKNAFLNLTSESQEILLGQSQIVYQGSETALVSLFNEHNKHLLDAEILLKLVNNEKIYISKAPLDLKDVEKFYIDRTFTKHKIKLKDEIYQQLILHYNGTAKVQSENKFFKTFSIFFNSYKNAFSKDIILISNEQEDFDSLILNNLECNIHWFHVQENILVWQQTYGVLSSLYEFLSYYKCNIYSTENDFVTELLSLRNKNKVTIIAAEPGMGKSTVLTNLALKMKKDFPDFWIERINLVDCSNELENLKKKNFKFDKNNVILFLIQAAGLTTKLEQELFRYYIENECRIILLLDGFDEISPNYKNEVITFLKILQLTMIKKICITTRTYDILSELEMELGSFSYELKAFSLENQTEFLSKIWTERLHCNVLNDEAVIFINRLFEIFSQLINDKERKFIAVPLQIRMIADVFLEMFNDFKNASFFNEQRIVEELKLVNLYENFIDQKFEIRFLEKNRDLSTCDVKEMIKAVKQKEQEVHTKISGYVIFGKCFLEQFRENIKSVEEDIERIKNGYVKTGIIDRVKGKTVIFVHKTFAEYFASKYLWQKIQSLPFEQYEHALKYITKIIFDENMVQVFIFFKSVAKRDMEKKIGFPHQDKDVKILALLKSLLNDDIVSELNQYIINKYCSNLLSPRETKKIESYVSTLNVVENCISGATSLGTLIDLTTADEEKSVLLSMALIHDCKEIANLMLSSKEYFNLEWLSRPLLVATGENRIDFVKSLLEKGACIDVSKFDFTELHVAVSSGHQELTQLLLEQGMDINANDCKNNAPVHYATMYGYLDILKLLIESGADVNAKGEYDLTPLHMSSLQGNLELVQILLQKNADVKAIDSENSQPLHKAVQNKYVEVVKLLLETATDINARQSNGYTPLHTASFFGCVDCVALLLQKGANYNIRNIYNELPLHIASDKGFLSIVCLLLRNNSDINAKNDMGATALHIAAEKGHIQIVELLLEYEVKVNATDEANCTPLHIAIKNEHDLIVKLLVERADIDINIENYNCETPLHLAVGKNNIKNAQALLDKGAYVYIRDMFENTPLNVAASRGYKQVMQILLEKTDINVSGSCCHTPLHEAVMFDHIDCVRFLLRKGAYINAKNNRDDTPLHLAAEFNLIEIVRLLLENLANVNARDHQLFTPLHCAAQNGHKEAIQLLLEKSDVNAFTKNNYTPLHLAVLNGHTEAAKMLLEKGADVNARDDENCTPLHIVAENGHKMLLELLLEKADLELTQNDNSTPLHLAALNGNLEIAQLLLEKGANVNVKDINNRTPLHLAAFISHIEMVKLLLKKGADVNAKQHNSWTPLHWSVENSQMEITKILIENGASGFAEQNESISPFQLAVDRGNDQIVQLLSTKLENRIQCHLM